MTFAPVARLRQGYYGWRIVYACMVIAVLSWGFGLFGTSVYLHVTHEATQLSVAALSSAISLSFFVSACAQMIVGNAIATHGPRWVMGFGAASLALGIATIGAIQELWHAYAGFLLLGMGWSCLSTTAISTTLAPWFDRHQGRAVSSAMLGASLGGMLAAPVMIYGVAQMGRTATFTLAALVVIATVTPLVRYVLRKAPADLGLWPDGIAPDPATQLRPVTTWTRSHALRSWAFWSTALAFGLAQCVQIGFLTHHVSLLIPIVGTATAAATITGTAVTAFVGRLLLARFSDRMDVRTYSSTILVISGASLGLMAAYPTPLGVVATSLVYGLMLGNITTMGPITVRREFGSVAFGRVYGMAATTIQLFAAAGPTLYGIFYVRAGSYVPALIAAGTLSVVAALVIFSGRGAARRISAR